VLTMILIARRPSTYRQLVTGHRQSCFWGQAAL
jgi:hypothetical protein